LLPPGSSELTPKTLHWNQLEPGSADKYSVGLRKAAAESGYFFRAMTSKQMQSEVEGREKRDGREGK